MTKLITACLIVAAVALYTVTTYAGFDGWTFSNWTVAGGTCRTVEQIPVAQYSYSSARFSNTTTGKTRHQLFSLTNIGKGTIDGIQPVMSSATGGFRVYSTTGTTAPMNWRVEYAPIAASDHANVVRVATNQFTTRRIPVSGTGVVGTPTFVYQQDFNTGSAPAGWTSSGQAPTWNFTPAVEGAYSVHVYKGGSSGTVTSPTFAAITDGYIGERFQVYGSITSPGSDFMWLRTGSTTVANVTVTSTGKLRIQTVGGAYADSTQTLVAGNWYRVLVRWEASAGRSTIYYSADTDGAPWTQVAQSTGTSTTAVDNIVYRASEGTITGGWLHDTFRVSNTIFNF